MSTKQTETKQLEQHPIALQYVPGVMSDEEFEAFRADLKARGQQHPIFTYEGKILDGMHRYRGCLAEGISPTLKPYEGNDPVGMVIALNVLRRKVGATQRAVAGAHLNLEIGISQDEASRRVGVSKVHINLVVQILKSKNTRLIKLLEKPDITREQLREEAIDCDVITESDTRKITKANVLTASAAGAGLEALFGRDNGEEGDEDLIGDAGESDTSHVDLDDMLGDAPPTAGGKVLTSKRETTAGGMPVTGGRVAHPERRNTETPASKLSQHFRGLTQAEQVSFVQLSWPVLAKAISAAGVAMPVDPVAAAATAQSAIAKASTKAKTGPALPVKTASKGKVASKASKAA